VTNEKFGDVGTGLNDLFLNVDGECVHLPEKKGGQCVSASSDCRTIRPRSSETKRPGRVGRVQNIQSFAPDVCSKLKRVPPAHEGKSVENFCDGCCEIRVCGGGWADLLEPCYGKNRQD